MGYNGGIDVDMQPTIWFSSRSVWKRAISLQINVYFHEENDDEPSNVGVPYLQTNPKVMMMPSCQIFLRLKPVGM